MNDLVKTMDLTNLETIGPKELDAVHQFFLDRLGKEFDKEAKMLVRKLKFVSAPILDGDEERIKRVFLLGAMYGEAELFQESHLKEEDERGRRLEAKDGFLLNLLKTLNGSGLLSHKELSERLSIPPAQLSTYLRRKPFCFRYIYVMRSDSDKRAIYYTLNGEGEALCKHLGLVEVDLTTNPVWAKNTSRDDEYGRRENDEESGMRIHFAQNGERPR